MCRILYQLPFLKKVSWINTFNFHDHINLIVLPGVILFKRLIEKLQKLAQIFLEPLNFRVRRISEKPSLGSVSYGTNQIDWEVR